LPYIFAPEISGKYPKMAPAIAQYTSFVEHAREKLKRPNREAMPSSENP